MNRRLDVLFLLCLLVATPALACNFLAGDETPIPATTSSDGASVGTAVPTPTVTPTIEFTAYDNEELGLHFKYPESWTLEESSTYITVVSNAELLSSEQFDTEGAGVIIAIGSVDDFQGDSLEEALVSAIEEFDFTGNDEIVEGPTPMTINGQDGVIAMLEGVDAASGQTLIFFVTLLRHGDRAAVASAITLEEYVEQYRSLLDTIVKSLVLSEPSRVGEPLYEGTVEYGDTVVGTLENNDGTAWTFTGAEGDRLDIDVTPLDEELDVSVDVLDSGGNSILEGGPVDRAFTTEELHGLTLPADDDYKIVVRGFAGGIGDYELTVSEAGVPMTGVIPEIGIDDAITATLQTDEQDDYAFNSPDNTPITIIVEPVGELDVVVEIIGPDDSILAQEDSAYGREQVSFTPEPEVDYRIRVRGFAEATGDYAISIIAGGISGDNVGTTVRASDSLTEGETAGHDFPFTAAEGDTVYAVVEPEGELDVIVEVWNDNTDEIIEQVDLSFAREKVSFVAPETGNFYFRVLGFEGRVGNFTITMSGPPSVIFELAYGDQVEGILGDPPYIEYVIRLNPGEAVQIEAQLDSETDALLEVFDLEDNLLAQVDGGFSGEPEQLNFSPPAEVTEEAIYIIRISDFFGASGGTFTMTVDQG